MSNWKTFKGATSPQFIPDEAWLGYKHSFQKIVLGQKTIYNEGNVITESDNSVWTPSNGAPPVTPVHEPCGYWYKEERKYPRELHYVSGIYASLIAWMPINGLPLGRFIAYMTAIHRIYTSDDGGYNWSSGIIPPSDLFYGMQTIYFNDGDVILYGCGRHPVRSFNGIDWEACGTLPYYNPASYSYHPPTDTLICASPNGANVSIDKGMTWTILESISYYGGYLANVYYKGYTHIMAWNYHMGFRSSSPRTVGSWQELTGLLSPWGYVHYPRAEAAVNDEVITYSNCYFDGLEWIYHGVPIKMVDYNEQLNLFAATLEPVGNTIVVSMDGISWLSIHTLYLVSDVAIGNDRIVGVGHNHNFTMIITY